MEIKTPVSVTNVFGNNVLQESDGTFIGDFITTELALEATKRINLYSYLVHALEENLAVWEMVCESKGWEPEHMIQYVKAKELMEKCK